MTLLELRNKTEAWFTGLGLGTPRLDAEVLIGHALGVSRIAFITDGNRPLSDDEVAACRELVRRRGKREPVAYILGTREFFSRDFAVDGRVLIPRPETELLVDLSLQYLRRGRPQGEVVAELDPDEPDEAPTVGERTPGLESTVVYDVEDDDSDEEAPQLPADEPVFVRDADGEEATAEEVEELPAAPVDDAGLVLDYGTGSGAIAVTLAAEHPGLRVLAIDVSRDALEVAKENATTHGVADRVGFVPSDGLSRVPRRFRGQLRAIVANPPYVPLDAEVMPDVKDWEPAGALFAGDDPLLHYRRLADEARDWLGPDGFLAVELGGEQAEPVAALLRQRGWAEVAVKRDLAGIPRVVTAWR